MGMKNNLGKVELDICKRYNADPDSLTKEESIYLGVLMAIMEIERPSNVPGKPNSIVSAAQELGRQKQYEHLAACLAIERMRCTIVELMAMTREARTEAEMRTIETAHLLTMVN
jgi:hypothetical protein